MQTKEAQKANALWKEQEAKNQLELEKKEKKAFLNAKQQMMIQLERDRCERMGVPFDEAKAFEFISKKE